MGDEFKGAFAVRQVRALLVRLGLRDEEADEFIEKLREEFLRGGLRDERDRREFCRTRLAGDRRTNRFWEGIETVLLGTAGNALWSVLQFAYEEVRSKSPTGAFQNDELSERVHVQWANTGRIVDWHSLEPLLRRAFEASETTYGPEDRRTAATLSGYASCLDGQSRHAEAESLFLRAFAIENKVRGPAHPYTGAALVNLGVNFDAQQRHVEAEQMLRGGLGILETHLGPEHTETAAALYDLGVNLSAQGRHVDAEPLLRRSLRIVEAAWGEYSYVAMVRETVAANLAAQKSLGAKPVHHAARHASRKARK